MYTSYIDTEDDDLIHNNVRKTRFITRDKSFKFLTYQLISSVLDYWGVDG